MRTVVITGANVGIGFATARFLVNSWSPGVVPTTQAGRGISPILKIIMMSRWFVNFIGSHLSTEEEAGRAPGGLVAGPNYSGVSGKYFDGFREIPSSTESRDMGKAKAVWEQSIKLAGLSVEETSFLSADAPRSNTAANYNDGLRPGVAREAGASD